MYFLQFLSQQTKKKKKRTKVPAKIIFHDESSPFNIYPLKKLQNFPLLILTKLGTNDWTIREDNIDRFLIICNDGQTKQ